MSMSMEVGVFLAYSFGVLMVYVFGRFLLAPLKITMYCIISSVLGGAVLLVANFLGAPYGLFIPLNIITAVIAGVLGIPGIIMLAVFFVL